MSRAGNEHLMETYGTAEALPVIFPTESFYGLHTVPNAALAFLALRGTESYMTRLAIWVPLVHGKANIVVLKLAIAFEGDTFRTLGALTIDAWRQKWVTAFRAEEMLLVIRALSEFRVIKCDEAFIHNRRLAVIAPRRKTLDHRSKVSAEWS